MIHEFHLPPLQYHDVQSHATRFLLVAFSTHVKLGDTIRVREWHEETPEPSSYFSDYQVTHTASHTVHGAGLTCQLVQFA